MAGLPVHQRAGWLRRAIKLSIDGIANGEHMKQKMTLQETLALHTHTHEEDWYPVFKARYGMEVVFRALHDVVGSGDVLTQLYTCITAVDPIIAAGLEPKYGDIDFDSLSLAAPLPIGNNTRAVVFQHTFGIIAQDSMERAVKGLRGKGEEGSGEDSGSSFTLVIEDCAHCAGRMARSEDGVPLADVTIFSFGVEKMLDTRFGGAVWVNPRLGRMRSDVDREIRLRLGSLGKIGMRLNCVARAYVNQNRILGRLGAAGTSLRTWMAAAGLYEPPISGEEMRGRLPYKPMRPSEWMNSKAAAQISMLPSNESARSAIVDIYRDMLGNRDGIRIPGRILAAGKALPLLRFPIFLDSTRKAEAALQAVRGTGALAERWYRPELFPGAENRSVYRIPENRSGVKTSTECSAQVVCLPTQLSAGRARNACRAVLSVLSAVQGTTNPAQVDVPGIPDRR